MSGLLLNLIIQIVAGAIGGNIAGAASKDVSLGQLAILSPVQSAAALAGNYSGQLSRCSPTLRARSISGHLSVRPLAVA
jgi:hypothetical protein